MPFGRRFNTLLFLVSCSILARSATAQFLPVHAAPGSLSPLTHSYALEQEITVSSKHDFGLDKTSSKVGYKNPYVAAALSLAVPGLGEYYVGENIWRGMIFTGLEVGLWLEVSHWNHRGDDSTASFRAFSDAHFSKCRYAATLDSTLAAYGEPTNTNCQDVHSINHAENQLDSLALTHPNLSDYTHRMPDPASDIQQYYEVTYKYYQYLPGWDNIANFHQASLASSNMNAQYQTAQYFVWGIIANHVLSAIDAALLATDHNRRLRVQGTIERTKLPDGSTGYVPTANIEYRF